MTRIFILGLNSFLAKNVYITLKKCIPDIFLLDHTETSKLVNLKTTDVLVNFCGINRSDSEQDYHQANHLFLKEVNNTLHEKPFLIHISSLMVYGFENKELSELSNYQKWFITSKLAGEDYLRKNYPPEKLCIVRPSNIFGYSCIPYYNNLLSTLVYEKLTNNSKIKQLNNNCYRNMLSIHNFTSQLIQLLNKKQYGTYNILSNNTLSLQKITQILYKNNIPTHITFNDGDYDNNNLKNQEIVGENIVVEENIEDEVRKLEEDMQNYLALSAQITIKTLPKLSQPRGDMVEVSDLSSRRLYKITFTTNAVRGNHYHHQQIEEFYNNSGKITYILAHKDNKEILHVTHTKENQLIIVKPNIIHTLSNDYIDNLPEIIICSTQEFVPNQTPDTVYLTLL